MGVLGGFPNRLGLGSDRVGSGRKVGFGRLKNSRFGLGFRWSGARVSEVSDWGKNHRKVGKMEKNGFSGKTSEKWGKS